eukprot:c18966_g1_i3 orf=699-1553(-)
MSSLSKELVFLILQCLHEEKLKDSAHMLEQESGLFFNLKYFEDLVRSGQWNEVERYLSGFTKIDDNSYSMKIFFEVRKQKYLEALDKQDRATASEILVRDLKVFSAFNEELYNEMTHLLTLDNFRENQKLSKYGDSKSIRSITMLELKKLIAENPLFREKLSFPVLNASRLRVLINQSLNWQHQIFKNPQFNPETEFSLSDHSCGIPNKAIAPQPSNNSLMGAIAKSRLFPLLGAHDTFVHAAAGPSVSRLGWTANQNPAVPAHATVAAVTTLSSQGLEHLVTF